jgi:DNA-binding CsgD family transcriptional regulator
MPVSLNPRLAKNGFQRPLSDLQSALAELHPMIDAGLRRIGELELARGRAEGMERFMANLPLPVLFIEGDGTLRFATQEAYDLCAAWNHGFKEARTMNTRRCFRLPAEIRSACELLAASIDGMVLADAAAGPECLQVEHPRLAPLVAKVELNQPLAGSPRLTGFWVTISSERNLDGASTELRAEAVQRLQFLTPSERRVALLVAEGCANQEVAKRLNKSSRTVECQLNTIYKKLRVSGRTELAHVLS